ncbi:MAG: M1 family metallopeptidase [Chloroflexi bacterium]|nr:M1 family metallopeptidase [Chloroflexota bacterium]
MFIRLTRQSNSFRLPSSNFHLPSPIPKGHNVSNLSSILYPLSSILYLLSSILYLLSSLFLTGCAFDPEPLLVETGLIAPTPTTDPFFHYRAALQPWARGDVEGVNPAPRYHISAQLDETGTTLKGLEQIIVPNPGSELVFRLYPNLQNYGGHSRVTTARINNSPVAITPTANGAAVRLAVPAGNGSSSYVTIDLAFTTQLKGQPGLNDSNYTLFGWDGPIVNLPGFYPTLAVRQGNEWVLDDPPPHGDVLFNEVALYQLDLTLSQNLVVIASGVTLNVIDNPDGSRTWQMVGGPLRDMTVIAGPFRAVSESAAGATITSYFLPGHEAAARIVLAHATASLRLYSDIYGPYPYTELDLVEAPLNLRGMEYSGLVLIGEDLYQGNQREALTFLVAHEVAHQWWYAVVGNNPYQQPWLDEGLTEYSAFEYYHNVFGESEAKRLATARWFIPFDSAAGSIDGIVDRPTAAFDQTSYELLVYAKAALFFNALREQLGDAVYRQVMQTYYAENRYRIVTPQTFLVTAQRVSDQNLNPLAEEWLR